MVAFLLSVIVTLAGTAGVLAYAKRRPIGAPHTWGEAMFGSMFVFFLLFMAYGVVPHQWLTWAENELAWRSDKLFIGWGGFLKPQPAGGWKPVDDQLPAPRAHHRGGDLRRRAGRQCGALESLADEGLQGR